MNHLTINAIYLTCYKYRKVTKKTGQNCILCIIHSEFVYAFRSVQ